MTRTKSTFLALLAILLSPFAANADIIDFDDLTVGDGVFIPQGYEGFSWLGGDGESSWVNNVAAPIDSDGAHSGTNYAWSNGGVQLDMSDGVFDLASLWARNRADIALQTRTFEGWLDGSLLFTHTQDVSNFWGQVSLNWTGINNFSILSGHNILIDDLAVNVPEPGTLALFGIGLFGMGLARRKKA